MYRCDNQNKVHLTHTMCKGKCCIKINKWHNDYTQETDAQNGYPVLTSRLVLMVLLRKEDRRCFEVNMSNDSLIGEMLCSSDGKSLFSQRHTAGVDRASSRLGHSWPTRPPHDVHESIYPDATMPFVLFRPRHRPTVCCSKALGTQLRGSTSAALHSTFCAYVRPCAT